MKNNFFIILLTLTFFAASAAAQTSWLDRPLSNWNSTTVVPNAPRSQGESPLSSQCRDNVRNPESISDRAVTRAGWSLFGASQTYGAVTLIKGMASVDGMCRPNQYNAFVFVGNRFAGTLSPTPMDARSDGALSYATLVSANSILGDFVRYTSSDALCCPSQTSNVSYTITNGRVAPTDVSTQATCQTSNEPVEPETGVVRGTVNFQLRGNNRRNWVMNVRLVDVTNPAVPVSLAEQRTEITEQQVPIPFEIKFDPSRIDKKRRYAIQAEVVSNSRAIFITDRVYSVLTQGAPNQIDLNLVAANQFGGPGFGNNTNVLRGTVAYRERILLPQNASVTVKLIDASVADGTRVVAETTFPSNGRQVPIPFELRYNPTSINPRLNYRLIAEIAVDGATSFITETNYPVLTQGSPLDNVQMILNAKPTTSAVVTGQTISLSKFGTGQFQIEGRNNELLLRATVNVKADGVAEVLVSRFSGSIPFTGKLVFLDQTTMRIAVESSGNADAGGEIEIKYNGRRLDSLVGRDLILDGQKVTLQF